mgnify:CR=1 FL=1
MSGSKLSGFRVASDKPFLIGLGVLGGSYLLIIGAMVLADVVFLTAMPPRHRQVRRNLLSRHGFDYPMIATEAAKGPAVRALHGERPQPLAFVDDIFTNLQSVRKHAPDTRLVNLMANQTFRALAPHPGEGVEIAADWPHAEELIRTHFASLKA